MIRTADERKRLIGAKAEAGNQRYALFHGQAHHAAASANVETNRVALCADERRLLYAARAQNNGHAVTKIALKYVLIDAIRTAPRVNVRHDWHLEARPRDGAAHRVRVRRETAGYKAANRHGQNACAVHREAAADNFEL